MSEADLAARILDETLKFQAKLPELLPTLRGQWVVFRDGEVKSAHPGADAAYAAAVEQFGVEGGYVVAPVVEVNPTPVTAGILFGLA